MIHERHYCRYQDLFLKRSLGVAEYKLDNARLESEAASLSFIRSETNIPIPKLLATYDESGSYFPWIDIIHGVPMKELSIYKPIKKIEC